MADALFWLVAVAIVTMATGAPLTNQEQVYTATADADTEGGMREVGKRAEEMVYYGNQQNEPRVPMKKSNPTAVMDSLPPSSLGEEDHEGGMVAHEEIPVEEDLNDRADAVRGPTDEERMEEGMADAVDEVKDAIGSEEEEEEEEEGGASESKEAEEVDQNHGGEEEKEENIVVGDGGESGEQNSAETAEVVDDAEADLPETEEGDGREEPSSSSSSSSSEEDDTTNESTSDSEGDDVQEFLQELSKESGEGEDVDADTKGAAGNGDAGGAAVDGAERTDAVNSYQLLSQKSEMAPDYYQAMYHILTNGASAVPSSYYGDYWLPTRRRRSPLTSIRSRRGHAGRFKRDLPSDWLALYRNLDLPLTPESAPDSLLSDPADPYDAYEPTNEDLSRYIYGNLLNNLVNAYGEADAYPSPEEEEEEAEAEAEAEAEMEEEGYPFELDSSDIPEEDSLLEAAEEEYTPEELAEYLEDYAPPEYQQQYRKRSGRDYYPDSRRKRYFYPAYEEPATHWGAFVPEKRDYGGSIERLQRLAAALSDNPRTYYDNLLRGYRK